MNKDVVRIFSKLILSDKTVNIKLLGDSITHGSGGSGFEQNGEPIVEGFKRNPYGYCWAKSFKEFLESRFNCKVINNACSGTDIGFVIENFDKLVSEDDDIIICTIGTNNRHVFFEDSERRPGKEEHCTFVYNEILRLNKVFEKNKKDYILVANIPVSSTNEKDGENYWRVIHMEDIHNLYLKAHFECGFPFIDMYSLFWDYCEKNDVLPDSLLRDGLHPNDDGYDVIFKLLKSEIGIV